MPSDWGEERMPFRGKDARAKRRCVWLNFVEFGQ